ncbi:MAG: anti-sigma factor antagonist [Clostridia bacterium]|nr:anti-sigma factor antagonist [Clostridia bacterium]
MTIAYKALADSGQIELCGELDHHAAAITIRRCEQLLDTYQPGALVLDLANLSFMDSSGIALLLKLERRMHRIGGSFCVANIPPQAYRVLVGAGINRIIKLSKKRDET